MALPKFPFSTNSTYFHMDDHALSIPLLTTDAAAVTTASSSSGGTTKEDHESGIFSSSSANIISRLLLVVFIGAISVWANHEASKGFKVTIINNAATADSPAGQRFHLFYVSNDEATRIILNTSASVENILYPHHHQSDHLTKKPVHHVILQLSAGDNLPKTTTTIEVSVSTSKSKESVYIISLSPSIMEESDFKYRVISAIQRAMARIWLWDGQSRAPQWLIDGMEEYLWMQAGFGETTQLRSASESRPEQLISSVISQVCSESSKMNISGICGDRHWNGAKYSDGNYKEEPKIVAQALDYLERENRGFIQGLNQILRDGWD